MAHLEPVGKFYPIETFDGRMFSIMSDGTPDCSEVFKYKGEIPDIYTMWSPMPNMLECTLTYDDNTANIVHQLRKSGFDEAADFIEDNQGEK